MMDALSLQYLTLLVLHMVDFFIFLLESQLEFQYLKGALDVIYPILFIHLFPYPLNSILSFALKQLGGTRSFV